MAQQMTKRAMEEALKQLLLEKPLDKITVSDITNLCGVNRMTFYYHFKDIYDLVEWSCQEDAAKALGDKRTYGTWQEGYLRILELVRENRRFFVSVYNSVSREQVELYLYRLTYALLIDVVEEKAAGYRVRPEDKTAIANFYKYGFVGVTLDWLRGGLREEPQAVVNQLSLLIHGNISNALANFQGNENPSNPPKR